MQPFDVFDCCRHDTIYAAAESTQDLLHSTFANLGYFAPESYGLTWKVRGLCTLLENLEVFDEHQVYGDIKYSDISGTIVSAA